MKEVSGKTETDPQKRGFVEIFREDCKRFFGTIWKAVLVFLVVISGAAAINQVLSIPYAFMGGMALVGAAYLFLLVLVGSIVTWVVPKIKGTWATQKAFMDMKQKVGDLEKWNNELEDKILSLEAEKERTKMMQYENARLLKEKAELEKRSVSLAKLTKNIRVPELKGFLELTKTIESLQKLAPAWNVPSKDRSLRRPRG